MTAIRQLSSSILPIIGKNHRNLAAHDALLVAKLLVLVHHKHSIGTAAKAGGSRALRIGARYGRLSIGKWPGESAILRPGDPEHRQR